MADNILINATTVAGGQTVATKEDGAGNQHEMVIAEWVDGSGNPIEASAANPMPVTDALAEAALTFIATTVGDIADKPTTTVVTSVADLDTNQTLLPPNARLGATVYNNSPALLYLKLGAIASSSDFTVILVSNAYYEVPFSYLGIIDGIWASDAGGAALVTEFF